MHVFHVYSLIYELSRFEFYMLSYTSYAADLLLAPPVRHRSEHTPRILRPQIYGGLIEIFLVFKIEIELGYVGTFNLTKNFPHIAGNVN